MNPYVWILAVFTGLLGVGFAYIFPQLIVVTIIAVGFAITLAPSVESAFTGRFYNWLRGLLGYEPTETRGLVVTLWLLSTMVLLGILSWIFLPRAVEGFKGIGADVPLQMKMLKDSLEAFLVELKKVVNEWAPNIDFDAKLQEVKDGLPALAGKTVSFVVSHLGGGLVQGTFGVGLLFFTIITTAFIITEYSFIAAGCARASLQTMAKHHETNVKLLAQFQQNARGFFRGMGKNMLIFAVAYTAMLYLAGVTAGRAAVLGLMLGAFAGIPKVGGLIVKLLLVPICLLYFGFTLKSVYVYGVSLIIYALEVNFITPRMIGSEVKIPSFLIVSAIVGGAALFGAVAGILLGIFALCFGKALWDVGFQSAE